MKHTNAKRLSLALLPLLAMAALAACAPAASDGGGNDPTKAHLSIGTLDAGIGGK